MVVLCLLTGWQVAVAQTDVATAVTEIPKSQPPGWLETYLWNPFAKTLGEEIAKQSVSVLMPVLLALAGWLTYKTRSLHRRLTGPRFALPKNYINRYQRVLLLGKQGSGKTHLIRTLFACTDLNNGAPNPRESTLDRQIYSLTHELSTAGQTTICRIDLEDYRGQDPGTLVDQKNREIDRLPYTAVILMVDIFETEQYPLPDDNLDGSELTVATKQRQAPDDDRVDFHREDWHQSMMQMLRRTLPFKVSYVCLFINKLDLLVDGSDARKVNGLRQRFRGLKTTLAQSFPGVPVHVILGSVVLGWGTDRLKRNLLRNAPELK